MCDYKIITTGALGKDLERFTERLKTKAETAVMITITCIECREKSALPQEGIEWIENGVFCVYLGSSNDSDRWQIYRRACSMARNHPRAHRDLDRVAISDSDQKRLRLARGNCLAYGRVSRRDFAPFSRVAPAMNRRFLYRNRDWTQFRSGPLMWLLLWL